jgi:hypothetical protein
MTLLPSARGFATSTRFKTAFLPAVSSSLRQSSVPEEQPSWIELPRPFPERKSTDEPQAELVLGRSAMVGALGFLVGEVLTGESVVEQCADFFTNLVI